VSGDGPAVYLTAADIAGHFGVPVRTVQNSWRARYGPGRTAEQVVKAPTMPQPDLYLGRQHPQAAWREDRLGELEAWRASLPGRGAGGGRPRKAT
jgi:hypothetical protein